MLERNIYHTLAISKIPQKRAVSTNIAICGHGHTYPPGKNWYGITNSHISN